MASRAGKSPNAFRTISEVADFIGVPQHVLRFWESKFSQINPMKRGGGRRYYRPEDVEIIEVIRSLLHQDGYTIKGAQKYLKEHGVKASPPDQSVIHPQVPQDSGELQSETDTVTILKDLKSRLEIIRRNLKQQDN